MKAMTKKAFENYFRSVIEKEINQNDRPALRQAWNDLVDNGIKDGTLPARAGNWSHPRRFYSTAERPPRARKLKIKTIDINALEWWDKSAGNTYFAGTITVNYGMPDEKTLNMIFQYGYGDKYKDAAFKELQTAGIIRDADERDIFWRYCDRKKIILRAVKHENCKKRDLMQFGAN